MGKRASFTSLFFFCFFLCWYGITTRRCREKTRTALTKRLILEDKEKGRELHFSISQFESGGSLLSSYGSRGRSNLCKSKIGVLSEQGARKLKRVTLAQRLPLKCAKSLCLFLMESSSFSSLFLVLKYLRNILIELSYSSWLGIETLPFRAHPHLHLVVLCANAC